MRANRGRTVICPQCGAEYRPGFTRCADCLVDLVEPDAESDAACGAGPETASEPAVASGPAGAPALSQPVCVYRATLRGRLPLAESLLRSADIPFAVAGQHMVQLTGIDGWGVAEVYVSAADADDARALLAELDRPG